MQEKYFTLPQIWDLCLEKICNKNIYVAGLEKLFVQIGITKQSQVLDAGCGSGFPALGLIKRGYHVEATDKNDEMIYQIRDNAQRSGVEIKAQQSTWSELPERFGAVFDLVMCRGNSLVYAYSWERNWIVPERSLDEIKKSLQSFHAILKADQYLYVDVTNNKEKPHLDELGIVHVDGAEYQMTWEVTYAMKDRVRMWTVSLKNMRTGRVRQYPSYSYLFQPGELEELLRAVGFREVREVIVEGEKNYTVHLARK